MNPINLDLALDWQLTSYRRHLWLHINLESKHYTGFCDELRLARYKTDGFFGHTYIHIMSYIHMWPYMHPYAAGKLKYFCRITRKYSLKLVFCRFWDYNGDVFSCDDPPSHTEAISSSCAQAFQAVETRLLLSWSGAVAIATALPIDKKADAAKLW